MDIFSESKLISAIISAFVAIIIFFLSQWFLSRRNTIEMRTKKLEEFYLAVNELSSLHAIRFEKIRIISHGDRAYLDDPTHMAHLYLTDINKKIIMYIRLYFPELESAHISLFHANREISIKISAIIGCEEYDEDEFIEAFIGFGDHLKNLESEIVNNKKLLVGENTLPMRYKKVA